MAELRISYTSECQSLRAWETTMYLCSKSHNHRVCRKGKPKLIGCRVKAASVNPIDMKVRAGVYDDYAGECYTFKKNRPC